MKERFHPKGLTYLLLKMMREKPTYGYEILKRIEDISGGFLEPSYGTVYGALERFQNKGYITRVEGPQEDRKYFELTEEGEKRLGELEGKKGEMQKKLRRGALGFLNVYKHIHGEKEAEKLVNMIEKEFHSG